MRPMARAPEEPPPHPSKKRGANCALDWACVHAIPRKREQAITQLTQGQRQHASHADIETDEAGAHEFSEKSDGGKTKQNRGDGA